MVVAFQMLVDKSAPGTWQQRCHDKVAYAVIKFTYQCGPVHGLISLLCVHLKIVKGLNWLHAVTTNQIEGMPC